MSKVNETDHLDPGVSSSNAKTPLRHDSVTITCPICERTFVASGRRVYCSDACRSLSYRRRHAALCVNLDVDT